MQIRQLLPLLLIAILVVSCKSTPEVKPAENAQSTAAPAVQSAAGESAEVKPEETVPAVDFTLRDDKGRTQSLSSYKGKVVWLTFWATWCHACKNEMKHLVAIKRELASPDFEVLAIGTDGPDRLSEAQAQARALGVNYPVLFDPDSRVMSKYNPSGELPFSVLIDRKGMRRHVQRGFLAGEGADMQERIKKLLAE